MKSRLKKQANEYKNRTTLSFAPMESNTGHELYRAVETAKNDTRLNIAVTSYRWGKHDPDGISIKAVLDGLTKVGILSDDSTNEIKKICYQSKKAEIKAIERTFIQIYHDGEKLDAWC